MYERILVPVEFGDAHDAVVRAARKLVAPGGKLHLLHVVSDETTTFLGDRANQLRLSEHARTAMLSLTKRYEDSDYELETEVVEGVAHKQIFAARDRFQPDAVVVGSHNRTGLQKLLLGSVAERVLRGVQVPVCVVKGNVSNAKRFGHVALATDFEPVTIRATATFRKLVEDGQAHGTVAHAYYTTQWHASIYPTEGNTSESMRLLAEAEAEMETAVRARREERAAMLESLAAEIRTDGRGVTPVLVDGDPWTELSKVVEKEGAELLVLGTHHYPGVQRLILGSIAEKTLRTAGCPVLIVPQTS